MERLCDLNLANVVEKVSGPDVSGAERRALIGLWLLHERYSSQPGDRYYLPWDVQNVVLEYLRTRWKWSVDLHVNTERLCGSYRRKMIFRTEFPHPVRTLTQYVILAHMPVPAEYISHTLDDSARHGRLTRREKNAQAVFVERSLRRCLLRRKMQRVTRKLFFYDDPSSLGHEILLAERTVKVRCVDGSLSFPIGLHSTPPDHLLANLLHARAALAYHKIRIASIGVKAGRGQYHEIRYDGVLPRTPLRVIQQPTEAILHAVAEGDVTTVSRYLGWRCWSRWPCSARSESLDHVLRHGPTDILRHIVASEVRKGHPVQYLFERAVASGSVDCVRVFARFLGVQVTPGLLALSAKRPEVLRVLVNHPLGIFGKVPSRLSQRINKLLGESTPTTPDSPASSSAVESSSAYTVAEYHEPLVPDDDDDTFLDLYATRKSDSHSVRHLVARRQRPRGRLRPPRVTNGRPDPPPQRPALLPPSPVPLARPAKGMAPGLSFADVARGGPRAVV
eukprot:Sspe_Gene.119507::Locus_115618_Transcript_1_1_Confidence_1.000_Length_1577::g.119507::m.119507